MNRVVVADDDEAIQLLFQEELLYEGYEVLRAGGREELLDIIRRRNPDLIILDVILGGENGLDVLMEIRNTYYDLPVVVCTSYEEFRHDPKSIAADYYVIKSSDLKELKEKIRMAMESVSRFPAESGSIPVELFESGMEGDFKGAGM
jgi:DNA-binding response OmpR family regulator